MKYGTLASFSLEDQAIFLRVNLFIQIQDFLNYNTEIFINFKEFVAFFFVKRVFSVLSNASAELTTG